jgi:hypothetical protein
MFRKPSIQAVIREQIYEAQRAIIDEAAKVEHAKANVKVAEAQHAYLQARVFTLRTQLAELVPEVEA